MVKDYKDHRWTNEKPSNAGPPTAATSGSAPKRHIIRRSVLATLCFIMIFKSLYYVAFVAFSVSAQSLDQYIATEQPKALSDMHANIHPAGTEPGCVIASPSKQNPNYYYQIDGSMTMKVVINQYINGDTSQVQTIKDYVNATYGLQHTSNPSGDYTSGGLGEPKFNVDGTAFTGPWGRPQNDGSAIRAVALIRFANAYLKQTGDTAYVKTSLYDGVLPTNTPIKADLEYVAHNWDASDGSYDLWEEVKADHFFTLMVQRRAMIEGAAFANAQGDTGAGTYYSQQASAIGSKIDTFWSSTVNFVTVSQNYKAGVNYKTSGLDCGTILGALHGNTGEGFYSPYTDKMLATASALISSMATLYPINTATSIGIGRYPEDQYTGTGTATNGGNPWFLCTTSVAELFYQAINAWNAQGEIYVSDISLKFFQKFLSSATSGSTYKTGSSQFTTISNGVKTYADQFMSTVQKYAPADGSLPEEFSRSTGAATGANALTWSYASFITATLARSGTPAF